MNHVPDSRWPLVKAWGGSGEVVRYRKEGGFAVVKRRWQVRALVMFVAAIAGMTILAQACGGGSAGEDVTPTATSPTAAATATPEAAPTAIASPPPRPQAMLSGKVKVEEPGVVTTEDGEELRVSLSGEGYLWRFEPGDSWTVSRADGTVLLSGTVVGEAHKWEYVAGYVRLDDGRAVAFGLDNEGNWYIYPAEETCRLAGYYVTHLEGSGSVLLQGLADEVAICRDKLGITEGIPQTP